MSESPVPHPDAIALPTSPPSAAVADWRQTYRDFVALTKPRITRMVVVTAGLGFALAVLHAGEAWTWLGVIGSLAGTAASCMAASVFNQVWERRTDALMPRTQDRPVAAGRVSPGQAIWFGIALALLGQGLLCACGTPVASALAGVTILLYVLVYTPMKRRSPWALWVGAIPGALPPVIGYAAATRSTDLTLQWGSSAGSGASGAWVIESFGRVDAIAWVVFAVMLFWQVPHFLAIAWKYRADYAAGGMKMRPVLRPDGKSTAAESLIGAALLVAAALWPVLDGTFGWGYGTAALLITGGFLFTAVGFAQQLTERAAMRMFFGSLIVLPALLGAVVVAAW